VERNTFWRNIIAILKGDIYMEWLKRFIDVMNIVSNTTSDGAGVTEIANNTGLSKGTLHRMLQDMVEHNLLTQNSVTRKYRLGPLSMVWGSKFVMGLDPAGLLSGYCDLLAERTNLYTYLCRFEAGEVYCIYTHQPEQSRRQYFVHVGQRMPLHSAASAKAILAFQPYHEVLALISKDTPQKFTSYTKTDLAERIKELEEIKKTRISFCLDELEVGVSAISTPIPITSEAAFFSISLVGSADYIGQHRQVLISELLKIGSKAGEYLTSAHLLASTNRFK